MEFAARENAPLILAFVGDLFSENSDVSFGKARVALDAELLQIRELGIWETDKNAVTYHLPTRMDPSRLVARTG